MVIRKPAKSKVNNSNQGYIGPEDVLIFDYKKYEQSKNVRKYEDKFNVSPYQLIENKITQILKEIQINGNALINTIVSFGQLLINLNISEKKTSVINGMTAAKAWFIYGTLVSDYKSMQYGLDEFRDKSGVITTRIFPVNYANKGKLVAQRAEIYMRGARVLTQHGQFADAFKIYEFVQELANDAQNFDTIRNYKQLACQLRQNLYQSGKTDNFI